MGLPRREKMNPLQIETHHIWSRCVRGAFLLGRDPATGVDVSHRRAMLEALIEYQASVFAIDWGTDHCLSNHLHGTGRNRPDIARQWSDEEVAWRWKMAWPSYCPVRGWRRDPADEEIRELLYRGEREPEYLQQLRSNLSNLSWFIARIKQPIAYFANRDNPDPLKHCRGHFWEGRYGNRRLDTFGEVLGSYLYNDLQQVRAGIVDRLEDSDFSAIQKQLRTFASQAFKDMYERKPSDHDDDHAELERLEQLFANCYLSPLDANAPLMTEVDVCPPASELILPAGYYHQPVRPNADFGAALPSAGSDDNEASAVEVVSGNDSSENSNTRAGERANRGKRLTIHNRLRLKQRRRASRSSILGLDAHEYFGLAQTLAEKLVEERQELRHGADAKLATTADICGSGAVDDWLAPGSASPRATPATFHRCMSAFMNWVFSQLPPPIQGMLATSTKLPRPPD